MHRLLRLGGVLMALTAAAKTEPTATGAFRVRRSTVFLSGTGPTTAALEFTFPAQTPSQVGESASWPLAAISPGRDAVLSFHWQDSFRGPTTGYHVLQVVVGGRVLWEADVAGGDLLSQRIEIPLAARDLPPAGAPLDLSLRLWAKQPVTNFAVRVQVALPTLTAGVEAVSLLDSPPLPSVVPWPPEPALPALPPVGAWTWRAHVIQPWGATQAIAVNEAEVWAPRLAREHGFNAVIVLPPAAHNAISGKLGLPGGSRHISEDGFRRAVELYRREGFRLILYSSIMHCGHDPRWQHGELARTRPEWAMRDAAGDTVNRYGNPWLCPSTGALQATLDYTAELVRTYGPDAVMLDNNEFMSTESGRWTCTCDACEKAFRRHLVRTFGEGILPGTAIDTAAAALPADDTDPLWGLWLAFRNRIWAEACEAFRDTLRQIRPEVVLLANTQYLYGTGLLAVDGQYDHLDAVLSESRGLSGLQMLSKMLLGRALARGRPLWNYIGTFEEKDLTRLRPPDILAGLCAASAAAGANPWVVFYGFTGEENQASLAMLRTCSDFYRDHAELLGAAALQGDVGILLSTESRDLFHVPVAPPAMEDLLRAGVALQPVRDVSGVTADEFGPAAVMVLPGNPCLRESTARVLADWVRAGGVLIVTPQAGWCDESGRWRRESALAAALGVPATALGTHPCGRGLVACVADSAAAADAARARSPSVLRAATPVAVVRQRAADGRRVLCLVGLEQPVGSVTLSLPEGIAAAQLLMPGHEPQAIAVTAETTVVIPERLGVVVYAP